MTRQNVSAENIEKFKEAMRNAGLEPPAKIIADGADGKVPRFHVPGDKVGSQNGWYVFDSLKGEGTFGCHKRGIKGHWQGKPFISLSPPTLNNNPPDVYQAQVHAECQKESKAIWDISKQASAKHPYIIKKHIKPEGIRQTKDSKLIVPLLDHDGTMHGLQIIAPTGEKRFSQGTSKFGHFYQIGKIKNKIYICEGVATGASIHEATGNTVVIAFDAGNLLSVAQSFRSKYPDHAIVICADNDQFTDINIGLEKATEAAQITNCLLAIPTFTNTDTKPTDFNDMYILEGKKVVKQCIDAATAPPAPVDPWDSQIRTLNNAYEKREPLTYIVDGLFPLPSLSIIYGSPGSLKSFFLADLAACVASGKQFLNRPVTQSPALFIDFDNGKRRTDERFAALGRGHKLRADVPLNYVSMPNPWLVAGKLQDIESLIARVMKLGIKFICIDNLGSITGDAEENSGDMIQIMGNLRLLSEKTGAAVCVIHHQRKSNGNSGRQGETLRGHSSIEASLDLALLVEREERSQIITVKSTKSRDVEIYPFAAEFSFETKENTPELLSASFVTSQITDTKSESAIEKAIRHALTESSLNQTQLIAKVKESGIVAGKNYIADIANQMADNGGISVVTGSKGKKTYSLPCELPCSPPPKGWGKRETKVNFSGKHREAQGSRETQ